MSYSVTGAGLNTINLGAAIGQGDEIDSFGYRGLNVKILPANGGVIVNVRNEGDPGRVSDLYVIGDTQDLGAEISKIITMHFLKK